MTDDANEIESILDRYRPAGPGAQLRRRIIHQGRQRSRWVFVEAFAAMILIGLNLAQISASVTHFISPPHVDEARIRETAAAITQLDLPVTPDEAQAMARRLAAGDRLVLLPLIHGGPTTDFSDGVIP